jgi:hypothetical protein
VLGKGLKQTLSNMTPRRTQYCHGLLFVKAERFMKELQYLLGGKMRRWKLVLGTTCRGLSGTFGSADILHGKIHQRVFPLTDSTGHQTGQDPYITRGQELLIVKDNGGQCLHGSAQTKIIGVAQIDTAIAQATDAVVKG